MSLYAISDPHLSLFREKSMDVFGDNWKNHDEKLAENWRRVITADDTVVIPGDISWGMNMEEALPDFRFIDALPGSKLILKGNHDYWWSTHRKVMEYFQKSGIESVRIVHNNAVLYDGAAICGSRGHNMDGELPPAQNDKLMNRELIRLRMSLEAGRALGAQELIVFLHYPPLAADMTPLPFVDVMREFNVRRCYFGHIHGAGIRKGYDRVLEDGLRLKLISCDYLEFFPLKIEI